MLVFEEREKPEYPEKNLEKPFRGSKGCNRLHLPEEKKCEVDSLKTNTSETGRLSVRLAC